MHKTKPEKPANKSGPVLGFFFLAESVRLKGNFHGQGPKKETPPARKIAPAGEEKPPLDRFWPGRGKKGSPTFRGRTISQKKKKNKQHPEDEK